MQLASGENETIRGGAAKGPRPFREGPGRPRGLQASLRAADRINNTRRGFTAGSLNPTM